ncbi:hypothetical protein ATN84_01715 [Paramesorhizobium deserti]|uniref:Uncharacterized protein n=1 Tax=Paramesorhizobium deserti TaxID=1494590 RepID=A0A135HZC7_9HYPH|nr:hypothetical protein [Paramesorhizobium deserti]KXF78535.1 hypothetical protein ATN84_01715 [Paramesorhizobium deserti]
MDVEINNTTGLKLLIARAQLGSALSLFIKDRDPFSVHSLACAGCELMEGIAESSGIGSFSTHILEEHPAIDLKTIRRLRNKYWNALKHFHDRDGKTARDDADLLSTFSDKHNDAPLFMGWHDYQAVTGRLPVEVQVFQVWWYAVYEDKLAGDADLPTIRGLFPSIRSVDRTEQKRRLRRVIEKYRRQKDLLSDTRTEVAPLVGRIRYID